MRRGTLSKLIPLLIAASGFQTIRAQSSFTWWDLRPDDYVRITATRPAVRGAVSLVLDVRRDTLVLRGLEQDETIDGPIALSAITRLELGRRQISVDKATWGPVGTALAGAGIAGGTAYVLTCGLDPCRDMEGMFPYLAGILGGVVGASAGHAYFTRGDIRWKPVILVR